MPISFKALLVEFLDGQSATTNSVLSSAPHIVKAMAEAISKVIHAGQKVDNNTLQQYLKVSSSNGSWYIQNPTKKETLEFTKDRKWLYRTASGTKPVGTNDITQIVHDWI